jgi:hypothetical protein
MLSRTLSPTALALPIVAAAILIAQEQRGEWQPERLSVAGLPNAIRIHGRVISGGEPAGEAAFSSLAELGVKTIISVDGAKPDVELGARHGLRYVHLPHGYNGVPDRRAKELAKAVRDLPGPIYIHCHHGKHRSPAAAAVACVAAGLIEPAQALPILKAAGTSEGYRGLFQSAASARRIDDEQLDSLAVEFAAAAKVPPIADAMVQLEEAFDHLKSFAEVRWQPLAQQPDLEPAHEAQLLKEHYHELARTAEAERKPKDFRALLHEAGQSSEQLERSLHSWQKTGRSASELVALSDAFMTVTKQCTACHQRFRDVPLSEKGE